jgi:long-chain fatty acid transport protein
MVHSMLTRPRRAFLLAAALVLAHGSESGAAGFSIFEQGARAMGFAGAFAPIADDPSAIFHNVGGLGFLKGKQLYLGGTLVSPSFTFTGASPFPGEGVLEESASVLLPVPALYYSHQFSESVVFGIGFNAPFGLRTEWENPDAFTGRYLSVRADLRSLSINPSIGIRLADRLSLGFGVDVRRSKVELDRRVPVVNPFTQKVVDIADAHLESSTDTSFGFNVGLLGKPSEDLSLGIAYRHKVTAEFEGTAAFDRIPTGNDELDTLVTATLPAGAEPLTTQVTFPSILSGGAALTRGDWTLSAEVDYFQWSTFDQVDIVFTERPDLSQSIVEEYENSWQFRFGLERRLGPSWAIRGGYYIDETPAPAASISPLLPDSSRHGFCLGGTWTNGRVRLDAGSWYVAGKERSTEGSNRDQYDGTYKAKAFTFGASLGYRF